MSEKFSSENEPTRRGFLKGLAGLAATSVIGVETTHEAEAEVNGIEDLLQKAEPLTPAEVDARGVNPFVYDYADTFYDAPSELYAENFVAMFLELKQLGWTGDKRIAIVDPDGNCIVINTIEVTDQATCELGLDDSTMPVRWYSKTPDSCTIDILHFAPMQV